MARLSSNGWLLSLQIFQVGIQDIDGNRACANGDMVRDRITTKRKLGYEWECWLKMKWVSF